MTSPSSHHHSRLRETLILLTCAAALAVAGCNQNRHHDAKNKTQPQSSVTLSVPSPALVRSGGDVELSDVAERVVAGVVNISSEKVVRASGGSRMGPLFNDPFFRHFFGGPLGPNERPLERRENSLGSGVIVSNDGVVLTNNHVIENAEKIRVALADGRTFDAEIVGRDPQSDLGVLKLKGTLKDLKPLAFGDSDALRLGQVVLAVGNPFGIGQTVTMGIVSAKGRASVGIVQYEDFIQTDAAINPGNSGGALVNMRGELVGINTAILSRSGGYQGVGFAIPSKMARPIMESLLTHGKVTRGWLGVAIQDVTPELKQGLGLDEDKGVLVSDVNPGSPAQKGGLERGDVVLKLDGVPMDSSAKFRNAVAAAGPQAKVRLEVRRDGRTRQLTVTLGEKDSGTGGGLVGSRDDALGGLTLAEPTPELRRRYDIPPGVEGAMVTEVEPDSVAARAGLRPGDMVVELNRKRITSSGDFADAYRRARGMVAVLVYRQGNSLYLAFQK